MPAGTGTQAGVSYSNAYLVTLCALNSTNDYNWQLSGCGRGDDAVKNGAYMEGVCGPMSGPNNTLLPNCGPYASTTPFTAAAPWWTQPYTSVTGVPTLMDQCLAEQKYVRGAQTRTLIWNQVSISGQALVFVVRTQDWSVTSRAGTATYLAFLLAQVCFISMSSCASYLSPFFT